MFHLGHAMPPLHVFLFSYHYVHIAKRKRLTKKSVPQSMKKTVVVVVVLDFARVKNQNLTRCPFLPPASICRVDSGRFFVVQWTG